MRPGLPSGRRVLLVEQLDACGAAPADAHIRKQALAAAGDEVTLAIVEPEDAPWRSGAEPRTVPRGTQLYSSNAAGWHALEKQANAASPELVVWAASGPGPQAASLGVRHDVRLWATGCTPLQGALRPLDPTFTEAHGPFAWTAHDDTPARRPRLSLWDGAYVLAPVPLAGRPGKLAIEAFARAIRGRDAYDLVVLSHPQPAFEEIATRLEIGMRVHYAGPAPREAELAWLQHAAAVMFAGTAPVSAGLPLRALAAGCPVLAAEGVTPGLAEWLTTEGVGAGGGDTRELARGLAAAMDGEAAVAEVRERGRRLAAAHGPDALAERVRRWRGGSAAAA